ncbi:MAG: toprim domain-containing protein [Actinomycetia bacterium]|nr:toprim domain-containing protein [Actinomycetes bacterium]
MDVVALMKRAGLQRIRDTGKDFIVASCPRTARHPFGDRHPSFAVHRVSGRGICLGCGWRPAPDEWIAYALGVSREQARRLIDGSGPAPVSTADVQQILARFTQRDTLADWAEGTVPDVPYLVQRGYPEDLIRAMQIRFHIQEQLVVIPWFTAAGNACYVKFRHVDPLRRYSQSRGDRDGHLYGEWLFSGHKADELWVVEGELDALRLIQGGRRAVAIGGASLSPSQARRAVALADWIVVLPDRDPAGYHGARQSLHHLTCLTPRVRVGEYPPGFRGKDGGYLTPEEVGQLTAVNVLDALFSQVP